MDYSKPENFVRFGSAFEYYKNAFQYIMSYYPYDGSSLEKTNFYNDINPHAGAVTANDAIAVISESGDFRLAGNIYPIEQTSAPGEHLVLGGGETTSVGDNGGSVILEGGIGGFGGDFGRVEIGPINTKEILLGGLSVPLTVESPSKFNKGTQRLTDALPGSTGVVVHDCSNGHTFAHTSSISDFVANFTNLSLDVNYETEIQLILIQGPTPYKATSVQIAGVAQSIKWPGGSPPGLTPNGHDILTLKIMNTPAGYRIYGDIVGYL